MIKQEITKDQTSMNEISNCSSERVWMKRAMQTITARLRGKHKREAE